VRNFGQPIAQESLEALLKPVVRGSAGVESASRSVGPGLFIVDGIAKAHGGNVAVESTLQEGTAFRITLPCVKARGDAG